MGYPVVTRLGVNQFWYRHWYTDTFYKQSLQQDSIFEQFVTLYVDHGTSFKTNTFIHEYWYSKPSKIIRTLPSKLYLKYYRRRYYRDEPDEIDSSYLVRHHSGEYFPMRCWILKYNNWVILSLKFFKPLKIKKAKISKKNYKISVSSATSDFNLNNNNERLNFLYNYTLKQLKSVSNSYYL